MRIILATIILSALVGADAWIEYRITGGSGHERYEEEVPMDWPSDADEYPAATELPA